MIRVIIWPTTSAAANPPAKIRQTVAEGNLKFSISGEPSPSSIHIWPSIHRPTMAPSDMKTNGLESAAHACQCRKGWRQHARQTDLRREGSSALSSGIDLRLQ